MELIKGNCLEKLKDIPDQSVDLAYMDLCYGQTACKWDKKFTKDEWVIFWKELKRVARNDRTPFFFSCTTKFGFDIIESNKKWFRWDLVWKKNRAAGFLNAYKLPMRKHEMIYCFSKKCPEYDVSSHSEYKKEQACKIDSEIWNLKNNVVSAKRHKVVLPNSDITPPREEHEFIYCFSNKCPAYDVSSHSEYTETKNEYLNATDVQSTESKCKKTKTKTKTHKVPLPTSDITPPLEEHELIYCFSDKCPAYDVSSHSEYTKTKITDNIKDDKYGRLYGKTNDTINKKVHKVPLPTSDITPPPIDIDEEEPSSWCEFKNDERTGHRTAKPVALMEFLLKYWCKEGGTVLDPTMGSGSMGIACKKMNRKFIGIELNDDIYELAKKRIGV